MRDNLVRMLRAHEELFPGIIGYDSTVIPGLVNAILSKHDFILLGLRGQAKTRILRGLIRFLDEQIPVIAGTETNDDPFAPGEQEGAGDRCVQVRGRHPHRVDAARRPLPGEARHAGRHHRGPHRRHRPHQGRHAQAGVRRRGGHPLRDHPPHQPGHLCHQRASRPPAAHPGGPAQYHGGKGHPDPRVSHPHAAGHPHGLLGEPRGLHQPREHHHPAEGPHRLADHHALPQDAGGGHAHHGPGGLDGARTAESSW